MELMIHRVCVMKPYHGVARRALWLGARGRAGGGAPCMEGSRPISSSRMFTCVLCCIFLEGTVNSKQAVLVGSEGCSSK